MTDSQFYEVYKYAQKENDFDKFVDEYAGDENVSLFELEEIFKAAHRTMDDIYNHICGDKKMSKREVVLLLSKRYIIPVSTMENWIYKKTNVPEYVFIMLQICEGLFHKNNPSNYF